MSIIVKTEPRTRTRTRLVEVEEEVFVIELDREDILHLGACLFSAEVGTPELRLFPKFPQTIRQAIYAADRAQLNKWKENIGR